MKWISVKDELPEEEMKHVFVYCRGGNMVVSYFIKDREQAREYHSRGGLDKGYCRKSTNKASCHFDIAHTYAYEITHWAYLPEPPTK